METISLLQETIDGLKRFFSILFTLDRFHGTAWFRGEGQLEFGVLAEAASVAQEWILFVIVDRSTFVTLVYVFTAVGAYPGMGLSHRVADNIAISKRILQKK